MAAKSRKKRKKKSFPLCNAIRWSHAFPRMLSGECWSEEWEESFADHSPDNYSSDTSGVPLALAAAALVVALPRFDSCAFSPQFSCWQVPDGQSGSNQVKPIWLGFDGFPPSPNLCKEVTMND
jgi:hypothetical protein